MRASNIIKPIALVPEILLMEHFRAARTVPADDIQLGEGSAPPPWATASSVRCEESRTENLTLLAEAADRLTPPSYSTPQPNVAERTTGQGATTELYVSKANSEPPLGQHHRPWQSSPVSAEVHHQDHHHRQGATSRTSTTPTANADSLLLPRAAAPTWPTQPTYPPGAGTPLSSL